MAKAFEISRYAIASFLLLLALGTLAGVVSRVGWPYEWDREEGFLLEQALRLLRGESIYPPIDEPPYLVGNYTPLFPVIYALVQGFFEPSLAVGRSIVFAAIIGSGGVIAAAVWLSSRSVSGALAACALFWSTYAVTDWGRFARVDFPGVFFALCAILCATRGAKRHWLGGAAICAVLALLCKQSLVAAPVAIALWLTIQQEWRGLGWFAGVGAALGFLTLAILLLLTGGQFWLHTVVYNANVMHWDQLLIWMRHLWRFQGMLLLAIPLAGWIAWRTRNDHPEALLFLIYAACTALTLPSIAKAGSAVNYLIEWHAAAALLGGFAASQAQQPGKMPQVAVIWVFLIAHGIWHFTTPFLRMPVFEEREQWRQRIDLVQTRVIAEADPVLTESPILAIRARQPVIYQPFIMRQLAREGKWDESAFVQTLESGTYGLIVTSQNLAEEEVLFGWTEAMRSAILDSYQLTSSERGFVNRYFLYQRKDDSL